MIRPAECHFQMEGNVFKVKNFYETTVPKLAHKVFQMYACTLAKLTKFIERNGFIQPQTVNSVPLDKCVAMMTAYIGSQWPTMQ